MKANIAAIVVTVGSLLLVIVHLASPAWKIDGVTVALLAMAILPWLRSIIKSVEIPGLKVELHQQGETQTPAPPATQAPLKADATCGPEARKILNTLWRYQKQYTALEPTRRWTFTVSPLASDYAAYLRGLSELVTAGLVAVSHSNNHCMLTNEGVRYCQSNEEKLSREGEIYLF